MDTSNLIANLKELSGLTYDQIARLFGVSRRSIQNWFAGQTIPLEHSERASLLISRITPLGNTADARHLALLKSSNGPSLFHQYVDEIPRPQVIQVSAFSPRDLLG